MKVFGSSCRDIRCDPERFGVRKVICAIEENAQQMHAQASFLFICKNFCSISSPSAPAVTFAIPLCILNADIPAHISDDWGVLQADGYQVPSLHTEDKDAVTQMILLCSSYCIHPCRCAYILFANSKGLTGLDVTLLVPESS